MWVCGMDWYVVCDNLRHPLAQNNVLAKKLQAHFDFYPRRTGGLQLQVGEEGDFWVGFWQNSKMVDGSDATGITSKPHSYGPNGSPRQGALLVEANINKFQGLNGQELRTLLK